MGRVGHAQSDYTVCTGRELFLGSAVAEKLTQVMNGVSKSGVKA